MVAEIANQAAALLDESLNIAPQDILVNADYLGAGYGILGQSEIEAIRLFARTEGLLLDPVYTGRAAAGLVDLVRKGFFKSDETVLFWHTGGTPALFAFMGPPQLTPHPPLCGYAAKRGRIYFLWCNCALLARNYTTFFCFPAPRFAPFSASILFRTPPDEDALS